MRHWFLCIVRRRARFCRAPSSSALRIGTQSRCDSAHEDAASWRGNSGGGRIREVPGLQAGSPERRPYTLPPLLVASTKLPEYEPHSGLIGEYLKDMTGAGIAEFRRLRQFSFRAVENKVVVIAAGLAQLLILASIRAHYGGGRQFAEGNAVGVYRRVAGGVELQQMTENVPVGLTRVRSKFRRQWV